MTDEVNQEHLRNVERMKEVAVFNATHNPPALNDIEMATRVYDPELGDGDESKCLPGWIETFCEKHRQGRGYEMSAAAVSALVHTLIAARIRCHRLVQERDKLRLVIEERNLEVKE